MKEKLKLLVCMCFSIVCLVSALTIEAAQVPLDSVIRTSQKVAGDWYDASGNKVLSISMGILMAVVLLMVLILLVAILVQAFLLFKRLKVEKLFIYNG